MNNKTWRQLIKNKMRENGDGWDNVETVNIIDGGLDYTFDAGYGGAEGPAFCLWTRDWVYFPHEYDGAESVHCVPRHPASAYPGYRHKHSNSWEEYDGELDANMAEKIAAQAARSA